MTAYLNFTLSDFTCDNNHTFRGYGAGTQLGLHSDSSQNWRPIDHASLPVSPQIKDWNACTPKSLFLTAPAPDHGRAAGVRPRHAISQRICESRVPPKAAVF